MKKYRMLILLLVLVQGCSEEQNIWGLVPAPGGSPDKMIDYLVSMATREFDKGNYDKALELADKANQLDPGSEEAAIVLAYVRLSLAGLNPFDLAGAMVTEDEEESTDSTETTETTETTEGTGDSAAEDNPLGPLASLLGLSDEGYDLVTMPGNQYVREDGSILEGAPASGVFADLPVLLPLTAAEARAAETRVLWHLAEAVRVICPFVAEGVKVVGEVDDPRHVSEACPVTPGKPRHRGKSHFLWAFAHLTEAIAFNSVVLYDPSGEGANLIRRSDTISAGSLAVTDYISAVTELVETLQIILPTDPEKSAGSMLVAMVNDLEATSRAFGQLPGIPEGMTASIDAALAQLNEQKDKIEQTSASASEANASARAMQESLTSGIADNLKEQIVAKNDAGELSEDEKSDLCDAYSGVSSEALDLCAG